MHRRISRLSFVFLLLSLFPTSSHSYRCNIPKISQEDLRAFFPDHDHTAHGGQPVPKSFVKPFIVTKVEKGRPPPSDSMIRESAIHVLKELTSRSAIVDTMSELLALHGSGDSLQRTPLSLISSLPSLDASPPSASPFLIKVSDSSPYSQSERVVTLSSYLAHCCPLDPLPDTDGAATVKTTDAYFFGHTHSPPWLALLSSHYPPVHQLNGVAPSSSSSSSFPSFVAGGGWSSLDDASSSSDELVALSLGISGGSVGVAFHQHGPAWSEVVHGVKRWILYSPTWREDELELDGGGLETYFKGGQRNGAGGGGTEEQECGEASDLASYAVGCRRGGGSGPKALFSSSPPPLWSSGGVEVGDEALRLAVGESASPTMDIHEWLKSAYPRLVADEEREEAKRRGSWRRTTGRVVGPSTRFAPYECTLGENEVLYVPSNWWHATLNGAPYNVFVSSFIS